MFQNLARSLRAGGKRRLYVSRRGQSRRRGESRVCLNEDEVAKALEPLSFEAIEPERLSMADQVAAFSSAEFVVGPSGSAMFNTVFCPPETKVVDIESEPFWIWAHTGLFASCKLRYGIFVGRPDPGDRRPVHRRWTVNVPALTNRVAEFLKA